MDYFDLESIQTQINEEKQKTLIQLESLNLNKIINQSYYDCICTNLQYSPKRAETQIKDEKIIIYPSVYIPPNVEPKDPKKEEEKRKQKLYENAKVIINDIITKVIEQIYEKEDEEESDDYYSDYDKLIAMRERTNSEKKKAWNKLNTVNAVTVFLFNTTKSINIIVDVNDTYKKLVKKVIDEVKKKNTVPLKFEDIEAYSLTLADEDEELPMLGFGVLDLNQNVVQGNSKYFALIYNKNYNKSKTISNTQLSGKRLGHNVIIKIFFKIKNKECGYKTLCKDSKQTLFNILQYLIAKDYVGYKSIDLYYFVYHTTQNNSPDVESALSTNIEIGKLEKFELDLLLKEFSDFPTTKIDHKDIDDTIKSSDTTENNEEEVIFNEISAGKLTEYEVIKTNKYQVKQERILGIDMYNIYNKLPNNKTKGFVNKLLFKKDTTNPQRKIKDIIECKKCGDKQFYYIVAYKKDDKIERTRKILFEVKNNTIRNEIVAKLNFLMKLNNSI